MMGRVPVGCMLVLAGACIADRAAPEGTLVASQEQQSSWVRNFNPFLPSGVARWPASGGIYEPLAIHDPLEGRFVPWLSESWTWTTEPEGLLVRIREGVRWSDGRPFGPDDVVFTFELLRRHPALDRSLVWDFVASVTAEGADVRFAFQRPYVPGLKDILLTPIVSEHRWGAVADPVTWADPDPVATGPFTRVLRFDPQIWELGRNPDYWQPGRPAVQALRFLAFSGNDQAALALVRGEVDWAGTFIPAVERVFVEPDPEHRIAWSPPLGGMVFLYANASRPPWDLPDVRRAASLALDRRRIVRFGLHDQTEVADASGMSDGLAPWRGDVRCDWITHDPTWANALLDAAGAARGADGVRRYLGEVVAVDVAVVAGWSDQVRAARLVVDDLASVGIEAHLRTHDFGAWFDHLQRGRFDLSFGWSLEGPSPYLYWRHLMSADAMRPIGEAAGVNWHRVGDAQADAWLDRLAATHDPAEQRAASIQLQRRFCELAPAIPLYPNPSWGEANTTRFVGFPSAADPWARLSPNHPPEQLRVMVALEPR